MPEHLTDDECGTIVAASLDALRVLGGRDADVLLTTAEGIVARHVEVERERIAQAILADCAGDPFGKRPCNPCRDAAHIARGGTR